MRDALSGASAGESVDGCYCSEESVEAAWDEVL
jgi:hypothetical protein